MSELVKTEKNEFLHFSKIYFSENKNTNLFETRLSPTSICWLWEGSENVFLCIYRDCVTRFFTIFLFKRFDLGPLRTGKNGFASFFFFAYSYMGPRSNLLSQIKVKNLAILSL